MEVGQDGAMPHGGESKREVSEQCPLPKGPGRLLENGGTTDKIEKPTEISLVVVQEGFLEKEVFLELLVLRKSKKLLSTLTYFH